MTLPPIQCPHCGGALKTEPGQLVGDPAAIETVKAMRDALTETADDLTFAAAYLGDLPNDPGFSAAYKRLTQATDRVVAALNQNEGPDA